MTMRGLVVAACVAMGMLVGAAAMMVHVGRGIDLSKLGLAAGPSPVAVVLSRDGGIVVAGRDDSGQRRSSSLVNQGVAGVDLAAFQGTDQQWHRLVQCVRERYADYDVQILDTPPAADDYILAMVGGPPSQLLLEPNVGGLAPHNGDVIADAIVFVFQTTSSKIRDLCQTTAHEIGHALGLDHSRLCSDIMSYENCGPKRFRDQDARCGEWEDRDCDVGDTVQNSATLLAAAVGVRPQADAPRGAGRLTTLARR